MQWRDESVPYELNKALENFIPANRQCICGSELMMNENTGEGPRRFYCPGSKRFFWEGESCKNGSVFAAPF